VREVQITCCRCHVHCMMLFCGFDQQHWGLTFSSFDMARGQMGEALYPELRELSVSSLLRNGFESCMSESGCSERSSSSCSVVVYQSVRGFALCCPDGVGTARHSST
jgi:hypothetical protein